MVADYAKKYISSVAGKIDAHIRRVVELFHQTRDNAGLWVSTGKEKHRRAGVTEDYAEATDEGPDVLWRVKASQEKLRCAILKYVEFLYSVVSKS
jgi:hypothetical protein